MRLGLLACACLALVAPVSAAKQPAPPPWVAGEWTGLYHYPDSPPRPPVEFSASLTQAGNRVGGLIVETATFGDGSSPTLRATVSGAVAEDRILRFTKAYDGTGGISHSLEYLGYVSGDGQAVSGLWRMAGGYSGTFEMRRKPPAKPKKPAEPVLPPMQIQRR